MFGPLLRASCRLTGKGLKGYGLFNNSTAGRIISHGMIACLAASSGSSLGQSHAGAGVGRSNTQAVLVDRPCCVLTPKGLVISPNTKAVALTVRSGNLNVSSNTTAELF